MLKTFECDEIQAKFDEILNNFNIKVIIDNEDVSCFFTKIGGQIYFITKNSKDVLIKNTFKTNRKQVKDYQSERQKFEFGSLEIKFKYDNAYDYSVEKVINIDTTKTIVSSDFHGDINRLIIWLLNIGMLTKNGNIYSISVNKLKNNKKIYYLGDSQTVKISPFNIEYPGERTIDQYENVQNSTNIFSTLLFLLQQFNVIDCLVGNHDVLEYNTNKYINKIYSAFYSYYIYDETLDIVFTHCPVNIPVKYTIDAKHSIGTLPLLDENTIDEELKALIVDMNHGKNIKYFPKKLFFNYIDSLKTDENIFWPNEFRYNKSYISNVFSTERSNELFPQWENVKNICGHCSMPTFPSYIKAILNDEPWEKMMRINRNIDYSTLKQKELTELLQKVYDSGKGFSFSIDTLRIKFAQNDRINPHIPVLTIDNNNQFCFNMIYFSTYYPETDTKWKLDNVIIGGNNKNNNIICYILMVLAFILIISAIVIFVKCINTDTFVKFPSKLFDDEFKLTSAQTFIL